MPLNDTAMQIGANAMRAVFAYAQLHSSAAGTSGTANVTSTSRQPATWTTPGTAGSFMLASRLNFTGPANGTVFSVTLWSASSGGTFYGEFPLSGDTQFTSAGTYAVTAIDLTGSAT